MSEVGEKLLRSEEEQRKLNEQLNDTTTELLKCQCANEMLVVEMKSMRDEVAKIFEEKQAVREVSEIKKKNDIGR